MTITDAMNEVAWCYLEGHGCKKDKVCKHSPLDSVSRSESAIHPTNALSPYPVVLQVPSPRVQTANQSEQYAAARYYRMAEKAGNKTIGNSW
jgi:TPR repeat protein